MEAKEKYVTLLKRTQGNIQCVLALKTVELYPTWVCNTFMSFSIYRVSMGAHSPYAKIIWV